MEEAGLIEGVVLLQGAEVEEGVEAGEVEEEEEGEEAGEGEELTSALAPPLLHLGVKECALGYPSASGPAPSL